MMNSNILFFYVGHFLPKNLGDWYISLVALKLMAPFGKILLKVPGSATYSVAQASYKKYFVLLVLWHWVTAIINKTQLFMVQGPGHHFSTMCLNRRQRIIRNTSKLLSMTLLRIMGFKIIRVGVSLGPFTAIDAFFERLCAQNYYFYSTRDKQNIQYLQALGIKNVQYFPDLSLIDPDGDYQTHRQNRQDFGHGIGLSFRKSILGKTLDTDYDVNSIIQHLPMIIEGIGQTSEVEAFYQVLEDEPFCKLLTQELPNITTKGITELSTLTQANDFYRRHFAVITNRLHVVLISMLNGCLPIAVVCGTNHTKVVGLLKSAQLDELIIDINDSEEKIKQQVELIKTNEKAIRNKIEDFLSSQNELGLALFKQIVTKPLPKIA